MAVDFGLSLSTPTGEIALGLWEPTIASSLPDQELQKFRNNRTSDVFISASKVVRGVAQYRSKMCSPSM